mgnify:CR=1 FL=1
MKGDKTYEKNMYFRLPCSYDRRGCIFSCRVYKRKGKNRIYMQICMVINMIYGIAGIALAGLMLYTALG